MEGSMDGHLLGFLFLSVICRRHPLIIVSQHIMLCLQSSHITCQQAGPILSRIKPRLAVLHHLMVNDASRDLIVEQVGG